MKYKKGDKIVISGNTSCHQFKVGTTVTISKCYPKGNPPHYDAKDGDQEWCISDKDIQE